MDYILADGVFARAHVEPRDSVCLWLGANVMVEYSFEEVACGDSPPGRGGWGWAACC